MPRKYVPAALKRAIQQARGDDDAPVKVMVQAFESMLRTDPELFKVVTKDRPADFDEGNHALALVGSKQYQELRRYFSGEIKTFPPIWAFAEFKRREVSTEAEVPTKPMRERKVSERKASPQDVEQFCRDLLAMPEHSQRGWTFALRLMRALGKGSNYPEFRGIFERVQTEMGVKTVRQTKPKTTEVTPRFKEPKATKATKSTKKGRLRVVQGGNA